MNVNLLMPEKRMSSLEIANLTGKRKNDIHQDIKTQLFLGLYDLKDGGNFHHEQIQGVTVVLDNRGYWSEVILDKYHTDVLISGYSIKYRAAIIKRWHELEEKTKELERKNFELMQKNIELIEKQKMDLMNKLNYWSYSSFDEINHEYEND